MAAPGADQSAETVVAIASSAGGITALKAVIEALPVDFPAAVLVVQHLDPAAPSQLAHILQRHSLVPVEEASEGARMETGHVYIAPPGHHLVVSAAGTLHLSDSPLRNFVRPSADELFESVAARLDTHVIAVVLTGTGIDGSVGTLAVQVQGGTVVVQDPETSQFPGMPRAAIRAGAVTKVVPLEQIAGTLVALLTPERTP
jgi:two-component system chemotaxis response regulator CheB